jgi:uncharacterized protein
MSTPESAAAPPGNLPSHDERTWGMMAHLSALATFIIPFGGIIGPLVVWLMKRDQSAFVADQGKEALNFNITMLILGIIFAVLILVIVGIFLLSALVIFWFIMTIVAAIKANEGVRFRYPFAFRLVK